MHEHRQPREPVRVFRFDELIVGRLLAEPVWQELLDQRVQGGAEEDAADGIQLLSVPR
jgi:hypothetical protein